MQQSSGEQGIVCALAMVSGVAGDRWL